MDKKYHITIVIIVCLLTTRCTIVETASNNILQNPDFEDGWTRETLYWTLQGGPFTTEFSEVFSPVGWTTWWFQDTPCAGNPDYNNGRPEAKIIGKSPDRLRVLSGQKAVQQFTFWRCHKMGLLQQVPAILKARYDLSAFVHSWYSQCSIRPHDPPFEEDCLTLLMWAHDWLSIGIDPYGGLDPESEDVIWSQPAEVYGAYGAAIKLQNIEAQAPLVTIWLKAESTQPLKHENVYWDSIVLRRAERVYLPIILYEKENQNE